MSFEIPEHVLPIREQVRDFIEREIYPVEPMFEERGSDEANGALRIEGDRRLYRSSLRFFALP